MYRSLVFLIAVAILISKQAHAHDFAGDIATAKSNATNLGNQASASFAKVDADFKTKYAAGVKAAAADEGVSESAVRSYLANQSGGTASGSVSQIYNSSSLPNTTGGTASGSNTATLNNSATGTTSSLTNTTAASAAATALGLNTQIPTQGQTSQGRSAADLLAQTGANCANEFGKSSSQAMMAAYNVIPAAVAAIQAQGPMTTPATLCAAIIQMAGLPNLAFLQCAAQGTPCPDVNAPQNQQYQDPALASAIAQSQAQAAARAAVAQQVQDQLDAIQRQAVEQQKRDQDEAWKALLQIATQGQDADGNGGSTNVGAILQLLNAQ